jgi:hypothetical protein
MLKTTGAAMFPQIQSTSPNSGVNFWLENKFLQIFHTEN